jgi:hypothetical protein
MSFTSQKECEDLYREYISFTNKEDVRFTGWELYTLAEFFGIDTMREAIKEIKRSKGVALVKKLSLFGVCVFINEVEADQYTDQVIAQQEARDIDG